MSARVRKAIGGVGILAFLGVYIWLAATLGGMVPDLWFVRLAFYAVAGVAWGVPLIPLIIWMNRGR
jgi:hypothetical protein